VWQHEFDHLNGTLLTDRMGPVAKMAHRKVLNDLKEQYDLLHPPEKKIKRAKRKA
jgi:peptide deformylase